MNLTCSEIIPSKIFAKVQVVDLKEEKLERLTEISHWQIPKIELW